MSASLTIYVVFFFFQQKTAFEVRLSYWRSNVCSSRPPHHLIWEGLSFDLLYSDIAEIYAALVEGRAPRLPELPVTYGDYAAWHSEWVKGPEYAKQLLSWRERLGAPNSQGGRPQALPTDKPRKRGTSDRNSVV